MSNKKIVLYGSLSIIFVITLFFSWYEGSGIRDDTFEWGNSTYFTNFSKQGITYPSDISNLDHFVYAAKFNPIFPLIMILSILLIVSIALWDQSSIYSMTGLFVLGLILIIISVLNYAPSTIGAKYFVYTFIILGISYVTASLFFFVKKKNIH
ncbi:hypothetical protein ACUXCC_000031 [Cytobacillus horneckiae]|uniref:DUF4306 domain-containing protein n=1 Tax=Cytobacillus horneckiae TaxID=549687 RepID=A0A2N0ZJ21_9BACI|nr:DUF4306 domain-containing protein [Cytobacillus horneckiae]MBN6884900.1 DUF4306 domain-containing protein [Cytobacillus horneckiae]MCM3179355.1 YjdJ family protein [Cytobacillus horneckiae]MEC1158957.1 DUF4306 domain-containing protein [Cytobacillus horneckiae]MED2937911.1 DUF4306 domain-containing protein [Cytobacillus horneckiae]PKG29522.1 DUF4306 domain-containing protein [Cytobacillus horneckiae]